ncbi:hypothetical protein AAE478_003787 [Parahypoxylon ruwenzoriense]
MRPSKSSLPSNDDEVYMVLVAFSRIRGSPETNPNVHSLQICKSGLVPLHDWSSVLLDVGDNVKIFGGPPRKEYVIFNTPFTSLKEYVVVFLEPTTLVSTQSMIPDAPDQAGLR